MSYQLYRNTALGLKQRRDNVWTFMLKEVEFRESSELAKVDRVKIVACDAKSFVPAKTEAE